MQLVIAKMQRSQNTVVAKEGRQLGTMITLAVGRLEVDWGKNNFFNNHGSLFQPADLKQVPTYYVDPDCPDGDPIIELDEGFGKALGKVKDRIELLGYTLDSIEYEYEQLHKLHGLEEQPIPFQTLKKCLKEVDVNRVSGNYGDDYRPGEFVRKEILERLKLQTEANFYERRPDHWEIDLLLENFQPNSRLKLLAENPANENLDVLWNFTPLVESGWAERSDFKAGATEEQQFLIVTEGSSDAKIMAKALKLYRPHVADFFRFVDMTDGYPFTGTGNLYRFTQGLVSIGIQNKTVIVYDNDAEGVSKLEKTLELGLPPNIRAIQLPRLDAFTNFRTIGPSGTTECDINGKAAAIECYLDLNGFDLPSPTVRWTSFNRDLGVYQGELEKKAKYMKEFLGQRSAKPSYDSSKIEAVLDTLISTGVQIAEHGMKDYRL